MAELKFSERGMQKYEWLLTRYPEKQAVLLPTLRIAEEEFGQLGVPEMKYVADLMGISPARVFGVVTAAMGEYRALRGEVPAMYVRRSMGLELAAEPLVVALVDYFSEAAERGAVRTDIPPERLAVQLLGNLFFLATGDSEAVDDDTAETAIGIFVRGTRPGG